MDGALWKAAQGSKAGSSYSTVSGRPRHNEIGCRGPLSRNGYIHVSGAREDIGPIFLETAGATTTTTTQTPPPIAIAIPHTHRPPFRRVINQAPSAKSKRPSHRPEATRHDAVDLTPDPHRARTSSVAPSGSFHFTAVAGQNATNHPSRHAPVVVNSSLPPLPSERSSL